MDYNYKKLESTIDLEDSGKIRCYSIVCEDEKGIIKERVNNVSSDVEFIDKLVNLLNNYEVYPEHMLDIIEDSLE